MAATVTEKQISEQRELAQKSLHDVRTLNERVEAEKRDMNADEKQQFDKLMDDVEKQGKALDDLIAQREAEGADEDRDDEPDPEKPDESTDEDKERSKRSSRIERAHAELRRSTGRITSFSMDDNRNFRAGQRYMSAYRNYLRTGAEHRDLSLGTDSAGGYLVTPVKLSEDIVIAINNLVFVRQMASITKLTEAKSLGNPQLTADIQPITWGNEVTVSSADTTMAFGRRDLTPNMATNLAKVSYRELQASARVEETVAQRISLSFAYGEETAYMTGTGSGQPLGVFTASSSGISTGRDITATGASHSFTADDLFNMVYTIPQQYQNSKNFAWAMHRLAVKVAVKLKDGNGQYLWSVGGYTNGLQVNRGQTLLGFPVCQSEYAPSTFATSAYIAVLGDFTYYRIAETMDMEIQRLIELFAASGQVGFLARKYVDGAPVLETAFARLQLA